MAVNCVDHPWDAYLLQNDIGATMRESKDAHVRACDVEDRHTGEHDIARVDAVKSTVPIVSKKRQKIAVGKFYPLEPDPKRYRNQIAWWLIH
jgi:hypothetical protein